MLFPNCMSVFKSNVSQITKVANTVCSESQLFVAGPSNDFHYAYFHEADVDLGATEDCRIKQENRVVLSF